MARKNEQEPAQETQEQFSQEEQTRLVELLREQMSIEGIVATLSRKRGSSISREAVEQAVRQLRQASEQAESAELETLFGDVADLEAEPPENEFDTEEDEENA